jgi:alkylation response protein AidB-like acyl-CoA dehydrogenase
MTLDKNLSPITPTATSQKAFLKGGHFLVGDTPSESIFISEEFTEEQLMIKEMVIDFCEKNIQEPFFKRGRELEATKPEDLEEIKKVIQAASDLGLCGVSIPEKYGGMELDFNTGVLFSEAIAAGFSFATTIGAQTSIGSLPIYFYGSEKQKQQYLSGIASGELLASYALTEPTSGSDANSGKTKATLSSDGKDYLINGQKIWITNGGIAKVYVVFAKIDDDKDLSAFIVERGFEGFSVGQEEKKMGIKASSTVPIFFDNCKVPVENLLGERGAGFKMALNILNTGRIKLSAGGMGGAKFSIKKGIEYALERKQFGQAISNFGAIKHKIGNITTQTFALDAAVYRIGRNIDLKSDEFLQKGQNDTESKLNAIREFAIECAILKVKGSELACFATDEIMQVYGGMGYAVEMGLEMAYRDARITKIYEGTNDVNKMLSVAELTKRGLQTKEIDLIGAGKKIPSFVLGQLFSFGNSGKWGKEKRLVQGIKNSFLLISGAAGKKMKKKLVDEQEIILNLSTILAEAYIAESVLLKIQKLETLPNQNSKHFSIQKKMMELYLYESLDIVRKAGKDAIASFATGFEKRTLIFLMGKLLKGYVKNPKELRREVANYALENKDYPF